MDKVQDKKTVSLHFMAFSDRRVLKRIQFSAKVYLLIAFACEFMLSRYIIQRVCLW